MSQSTGVRLPRLWGWFALLVLAISTALFLEFDERDLRRHVLSWRGDRGIAASGNVAVNVEGPVLADTTYAVWMVSRNAYTLTNRPSRLFDAEHCAPAKRTMTFGEPMITMGTLAIPFYLASGDPMVTYNLTQWALWTLSGFAVFLVVASWSAMPAAGLAAALLYVFHPAHSADISHPTIADMTWTAFAFYFAERWFARGWWRDAIGLAVSVVLQLAASFYPFMAAVFLSLPVAAWLLFRYGVRRLHWLQVLFVIAAVAAGAAFVFYPYLAARADTEMLRRSIQMYASWSSFVSEGQFVPAVVMLALVAVALLAGKRRTAPGIEGDPRLALLIGALLAALAATGGTGVTVPDPSEAVAFPPNIYALLSSVLPGLDSVRAIMKLKIGFHLGMCILAGLGMAGVIRLFGRWRHAVAALLVCLIAVAAIQPPALGFAPHHRWGPIPLRPSRELLALFAMLERRGNRGPVLEVPVGRQLVGEHSNRLLASAWHHRRTSHCYASYVPPEVRRVTALSKELDDPRTIQTLGRLGFTTILVHEKVGGRLRTMIDDTIRWQPHLMRLVFATHTLAAYELGAPFLPVDIES